MGRAIVRNMQEEQRDYANAKKQREVFYGKPVQKEKDLPFTWPTHVRYLGKTHAQIYYSDKMLNGGEWELYKHIAEGEQFLFVNDENTSFVNDATEPVEIRETGRRMAPPVRTDDGPAVFFARTYEIAGEMPTFISDLAQNKGVQWRGADGRYYEARIAKSTIASAKHPDTGETFLVVYSPEGVHFLITGKKLNITKDGIVG